MAFSVKGKARQSTSISRESEGQKVLLRALRDGSPISADWRQAAVMGGFGYMVNEGAFITGQQGGGEGTGIDKDQPELVISVPNGYSIMPLRIDVSVLPGAYAAEDDLCQILIACDQDSAYVSGTGTCDTINIYNMNTLCGKTSACTCIGGCSGGITAPVLDLELAHMNSIGDEDTAPAFFQWHQMNLIYEPKNPIILNGPAMVCVYFGSDAAATGFISAQWLEFPETVFSIS